MSILQQKLNEDETNSVYLWVDQVSLTRPKRNIARDFSDCVLVAEVVKHFHSKLVDIHNYPQAHNLKQKFTNWNTLNKKVLKRLNMQLSEEEIDDLANAKPGNIERFLFALRTRMDNFQYEPVTIGHAIPGPKQKQLNYAEISKQHDQSQFAFPKNENVNYYNSQGHASKGSQNYLPPAKPMTYAPEKQPIYQNSPMGVYSAYRFGNQQTGPGTTAHDARPGN
jgi:hypothetical protein